MPNIHAIRDDIVRARVSLAIALNELYREDPEAGKLAYNLSITHIMTYFEGARAHEEDVQEQGDLK